MQAQATLHDIVKQSEQSAKQFHLPWKLWLQRHRTRKQLHALSLSDPDRLLKDLALHPHTVRLECAKPFWRE